MLKFKSVNRHWYFQIDEKVKQKGKKNELVVTLLSIFGAVLHNNNAPWPYTVKWLNGKH